MKTVSLVLMATLLIGSAAFADNSATSGQNQLMKMPPIKWVPVGNPFINHPIPPVRHP